MALAQVQRPGETLQFTDGFTGRKNCYQFWAHRNKVINGAFVDGHAGRVSMTDWDRVGRDASGFYYAIAAADR